MNILITSASRKVSLVRAFQQALAQEDGGSVIAVDSSPHAPALYCANEYRLVPPMSAPGFIEAMLDLCAEKDVRVLIPTRDEELPFFAVNKERFDSRGVAVMVSGLFAVNTCQDKRAFVVFCGENGFRIPETFDPDAAVARGRFPLFVRPRRSKGGRRAVRVDSGEELEAVLKVTPDTVVQEWIGGPEFSIDLFSDFSGTVISAVPRERIRIVGGEAFACRTRKDAVLIGEAARLAVRLGLTGHSTIQCFLDRGIVKFIEVNPRFGGAAHLGFEAGAPTPLYLVKLLKGESLEPRLGLFRDNLVMLRYGEDIFIEGNDINAGVNG